MSILFLTRKTPADCGGLSRFCNQLTAYFPLSQVLQVTSLASWRRLRTGEVSIIHATDATLLPIGFFLKFLLRKPLTLTAHGLDLVWSNPLYQSLLRTLLPRTNAIATDSAATKQLASKFSFSRSRISIIPPGISVDHLQIQKPLPLPDSRGKIVLLSVGNLVPRKGHRWFVEHVLPDLPDQYIYSIVGDGPERELIERAIEQRGLSGRVFLTGRINNAQLARILRHADIYIAPNQHLPGDFEGFGIAIGEAAAMGLAVAASNVDGIADIIHDQKNGWLIPSTADAFCAALTRLKDPKTRKLLGQRARAYTRTHFSWQKSGEQYDRFFSTVLGR